MQKTKNYNKLNIFLHCLALIRGQAAEWTYIAEYTYDENGIKTSVKAEGKTTYFIYEGNTLLGQYTDNDGTIENAMQFLYDENGEIQGVQHNGRMYYYQKDIMGNVYSIRNTFGNGICSYKYEAYGHNFFSYGSNDDFRNINPIKYRGYYYDSYYGGYYNLSRYYNPGMGRFLNLDDPMIALQSKSDPDGMNLYTYCNNDPVNYVDPTGKSATVASAATILAIGFTILVVLVSASAAYTNMVNGIPNDFFGRVISDTKERLRLIVNMFTAVASGVKAAVEDISKRIKKNKKSNSTQEHHIVPRKVKLTLVKKTKNTKGCWVYVKENFLKAGLSIEGSYNKIKLKTRVHRALNTNIYYSWVYYLTSDAYYRSSNKKVRKALVLISVLYIKSILSAINKKSPN